MSGAVTDEDLIESARAPRTALRRAADHILQRPAAVAMLVAGALIVGSTAGFLVGQGNPQVLSGISISGPAALGVEQTLGSLGIAPFGPPGSGASLPVLSPEDLTALGEVVSRQFQIQSGQSSIPALCETTVGQPGYSRDNRYPSTIFRVDGGKITQLIWPRANETAASGTLQTLVSQAKLCPGVPYSNATIVTAGVQTGIGDEYAVFHYRPTISGPSVFFATVVLVRVGADLIEVSFTSDIVERADAEARCLRAAAAAVETAAGR